MPLLFVLGLLVVIIGAVIFTVNKRDSDRFIEMQTKAKYEHKKAAEDLNTFRNDPSEKDDDTDKDETI